MARTRTQARCQDCGHAEPKWLGQCPDCGAWGTMLEEAKPGAATSTGPAGARAGGQSPAPPSAPAVPIADVPGDADQRLPTGIGELDRVLGGGLVPGSVTLLGGEPGAGKSTLLLQAAQALARRGDDPDPRAGDPRPGGVNRGDDRPVLYVSAEESAGQVRLRAERLGILDDRLLLAAETDLAAVLALVEHHRPAVLVCDSIQSVADAEVAGSRGGVAQVRECADTLTRTAKRHRMATILVGHVTKDGQLAGPRTLEHLVDTVCELEGDRHHALRLVRAAKNRYGPVGEVGCFEMTEGGLADVADASQLFVGEAAEGTTGVAVTLTLEGRRPLACEVQALVSGTRLAQPRRVASGLDTARLALLVAVLDRRADVDVKDYDVFVSTVGGVRLTEPAVDLALCLALASSRRDQPVPRDLVAAGEVGLAGELRLVTRAERRVAEAARLGFGRILVPASYDGDGHGLDVRRASDLAGALAAGLQPG